MSEVALEHHRYANQLANCNQVPAKLGLCLLSVGVPLRQLCLNLIAVYFIQLLEQISNMQQ